MSQSATNNLRLLLVDDNERVRDIMSRLLESYGFELRTAEDAESALADLDRHPADVVVTDVRMPHRSGCWLIREVVKRYPETRCLLISGYFHEEMDELRECEESMPLLHKPFKTHGLGQRLRDLMDEPPWHPTMKRRKGD